MADIVTLLAKGCNFLFARALQGRRIFISSSLSFTQSGRNVDLKYFDYIRLATLELVSEAIYRKQVGGAVAELGVYKGNFARYINKYFPDRSLYLFDTFSGFDERDIAKEQQLYFSDGRQDFSDTSVESVLRKMPLPHQCIPVKGYFPQSAANINEKFAFVSLDTDLYEPIYEGLRYFYARLMPGGYIFVHDYNNDAYKGTKAAVDRFCTEQSINIVPLPDSGGTGIISK